MLTCAGAYNENGPGSRTEGESPGGEHGIGGRAAPCVPADRVVAGDTMFSIAFRNQLDYRDLAVWNDIGPDYLIKPGQVLRLTPPPVRATTSASSSIQTTPTERPRAPVSSSPLATRADPPLPAPHKWLWPAKGEVLHSADTFEWFAEEGKRAYGQVIPQTNPQKRHMTIKHPVGVVGAIGPWNFPITLQARKIAPALAAGCTIVCKPASQTPLSLIGVFQCMTDAGLPKGVANLVIGSASGLYGFAQMGVGAICTALVGMGSNPALTAAIILVSAGVIGQTAFWLALRYRARTS